MPKTQFLEYDDCLKLCEATIQFYVQRLIGLYSCTAQERQEAYDFIFGDAVEMFIIANNIDLSIDKVRTKCLERLQKRGEIRVSLPKVKMGTKSLSSDIPQDPDLD